MDRKTLTALLLIGLFVTVLFVGTVLYFQNQISAMNAQITSLDSQVKSINSEIFNKLENPYLVTTLGIGEVNSSKTYNENDPSTYNHLLISGAVTNFGFSTAYNAGLNVTALDSSGQVVVKMIVPLTSGSYGPGHEQGATAFTVINKQDTLQTEISIYHVGVAASWTETPVYTS
jgi:hypothetical protein